MSMRMSTSVQKIYYEDPCNFIKTNRISIQNLPSALGRP
jgi:hypothetical protein